MIIGSYFIGSLTFGNIISRIFFHDDITASNSKSAGATNIKRKYGWKVSIIVLFLDMLKIYSFLWITALLIHNIVFFKDCNFFLIGFGAILGHAFPIYFKFKGGKSTSVFWGIVAFYNPIFFIVTALIWWIVFLISRYSSLSSLLCVTISSLIIILTMSLQAPFLNEFFVQKYIFNNIYQYYSVSIASLVLSNLMVIFLHKENIYRLITNKEVKINLK